MSHITKKTDSYLLTVGWVLLLAVMLPVFGLLMVVDYVFPIRFPSDLARQEAEEEEEEE